MVRFFKVEVRSCFFLLRCWTKSGRTTLKNVFFSLQIHGNYRAPPSIVKTKQNKKSFGLIYFTSCKTCSDILFFFFSLIYKAKVFFALFKSILNYTHRLLVCSTLKALFFFVCFCFYYFDLSRPLLPSAPISTNKCNSYKSSGSGGDGDGDGRSGWRAPAIGKR